MQKSCPRLSRVYLINDFQCLQLSPINLFPKTWGFRQCKEANRRQLGACRAELLLGCPRRRRWGRESSKLVPETQYEKNIIVTNWIQEVNTMHLLRLLARTKLYRAATTGKLSLSAEKLSAENQPFY